MREAFEAEGFEVIGTSTSGQAAQTLKRQAGISSSRTLATLSWRLDHGRLELTNRRKAGALVVRMDDGGDLRRLKAEEIAVDRLAHAYAVTVHRSQGSTVHGPTPWRTAAGGELA